MQMQEDLEKREQANLEQSPVDALSFLADRNRRSKIGTSLQEIIDQILVCWGGPGELAKAFYDQYRVARPGSMMRSRALEKMLELIKVYQQLYGNQDEVEEMDEQEARAELRSLMQELHSAGGDAGVH
jgi:hypothetical protein